jgi:Iron-sulfur cluster assembly accessory protein
MAITLTEQAAKQIQRLMAKQPGLVGLRLGVKPSGCSGLSYTVDGATEVGANDTVFEQHGVKVVVDGKSLPFLQGVEVDYVREGLNQRFAFNNPNAKGTCGCGESFAI